MLDPDFLATPPLSAAGFRHAAKGNATQLFSEHGGAAVDLMERQLRQRSDLTAEGRRLARLIIFEVERLDREGRKRGEVPLAARFLARFIPKRSGVAL